MRVSRNPVELNWIVKKIGVNSIRGLHYVVLGYISYRYLRALSGDSSWARCVLGPDAGPRCETQLRFGEIVLGFWQITVATPIVILVAELIARNAEGVDPLRRLDSLVMNLLALGLSFYAVAVSHVGEAPPSKETMVPVFGTVSGLTLAVVISPYVARIWRRRQREENTTTEKLVGSEHASRSASGEAAYVLRSATEMLVADRAPPQRAQEPAWDVFLSHATEDKDVFARALADELRKAGKRVWFDEFTLRVGDSLRQSIEHGIGNSSYGVVLVSKSFLDKAWSKQELDGMTALEIRGRKVVLPVWHQVDHEYVSRYSPMLADRVAADTSKGLENVVEQLLEAMRLADKTIL